MSRWKERVGKDKLPPGPHPPQPSAGQPKAFDVNDDYPRAEATDMESRLADPKYPRPTVVKATYRLSPDDLKAVTDAVGLGVFAPEVTHRCSLAP